MMIEEILTPISQVVEKTTPTGRRADILAALLAGLGASLSVLSAGWFLAGFAENDTRPEHLASAISLTLILFAFAIVPFICVAQFARRAYRLGTKRAHLLWTLFLMLPWVLLGSLAVSHTPLPLWSGLIMAGLAGLLSLWALISLILDRRQPSLSTDVSQEYEMPDPCL